MAMLHFKFMPKMAKTKNGKKLKQIWNSTVPLISRKEKY